MNLIVNKIWVDEGSEYYNRSMKTWLHDIALYSTHNETISAVAERFIRTLKTKFTNIRLQYPKMCTFIN